MLDNTWCSLQKCQLASRDQTLSWFACSVNRVAFGSNASSAITFIRIFLVLFLFVTSQRKPSRYLTSRIYCDDVAIGQTFVSKQWCALLGYKSGNRRGWAVCDITIDVSFIVIICFKSATNYRTRALDCSLRIASPVYTHVCDVCVWWIVNIQLDFWRLVFHIDP